MAELICKNCGGTMQPDEENEYAVCEYCGAKIKIEKSDAEIQKETRDKRKRERNENKQRIKKKIKKIVIIIVAINVAFYAIMLILGMFGVFDEDKKSENTTTISNSVDATATNSTVATTEKVNPIELMSLSNDLETAKQILGEETENTNDIEAYTKHTFGNVSILCEYETNNIYSICVNYESEDSKEKYTVMGINGNSTIVDCEKAIGTPYYQDYDENGNKLKNYEAEYKGNNFEVEITFVSEKPIQIRIWPTNNTYSE